MLRDTQKTPEKQNRKQYIGKKQNKTKPCKVKKERCLDKALRNKKCSKDILEFMLYWPSTAVPGMCP